MQENKLVSAIITTHNRSDLLKQAIKSVKQQTYIDIEVIVVDDASTDGTKEYCTALTGIHYIYISPAESKGGNHARNVGIENCTASARKCLIFRYIIELRLCRLMIKITEALGYQLK